MTEHASSGIGLVGFHVLESKQSLVGRPVLDLGVLEFTPISKPFAWGFEDISQHLSTECQKHFEIVALHMSPHVAHAAV